MSERYGKLSWSEHLSLVFSATKMPFALVFNLISFKGNKSWKRRLTVVLFRYLTGNFNYRQLQNILGTSTTVYTSWAKQKKLDCIIEQLGDTGGKLFWVGPKRTDHVILYVHGGAFLLPIQSHFLDFWKYVQTQLAQRKVDMGIAVLSYTLVPDTEFPTPLCQMISAVQHLIDSGVSPQNIQLTGDSAGANICLQFLSHLLHPLPSIPSFTLPEVSRFRSLYLMSPWIALSKNDTVSFGANGHSDIFAPDTLQGWGRRVLASVPDSKLPYADAANAPEDWFMGIEKLVERILITTGSSECLRDVDERLFESQLNNCHSNVQFIVQEGGVHDDPLFDFFLNEKVGKLTPIILDWFADGYKTTVV